MLKGKKKLCHANTDQKEAGVAALIDMKILNKISKYNSTMFKNNHML